MIVKNTFLSIAILSNFLLVFSSSYTGKWCLCAGERVLCGVEGWAVCGGMPGEVLYCGWVEGGERVAGCLGRSLLCRVFLFRNKISLLCPSREKYMKTVSLLSFGSGGGDRSWPFYLGPLSVRCGLRTVAVPQMGVILVLCRSRRRLKAVK